jgi:hypothetical protein
MPIAFGVQRMLIDPALLPISRIFPSSPLLMPLALIWRCSLT